VVVAAPERNALYRLASIKIYLIDLLIFLHYSTYGVWIENCPGFTISIIPAQLHRHFDISFRAGTLPIRTAGEPGDHGAGVTGTQGIGVKTPDAAAVADATEGFARL
jgi:hypothetical protein